jgi:queuine tRNA-ribosyltransferase
MDMFDCVLPTRLARTGSVYLWDGRKSIRNASFRGSEEPLCEGCDCHTCTNFSRGYLHHLLMEKEMTGLKLLSIHNIHFLYSLMRKSRDLIDKGEFYPWYEEFIKKYKAM